MSNYTDLKYCVGQPPFGDGTTNTGIICKINGKNAGVPIDKSNADYLEIMELVSAGTLTIAAAD